ncbi:bacterial-type NHL repeat-containing protein, putative, partial [Bodo saltans]
VPVVVTSVSRTVWVASYVIDIAVDRDNSLLYVSYAGYCVYRLASNGVSAQVIAGSSTTSGTADGVGGAARFNYLYGLTCDTASNVAYISDYGNKRIRTLDLTNNNVATLAGSSYGTKDGIGVLAQFSGPSGIVHYTFSIDGMVLFVADTANNRIRRIVVASATVTTVAQIYACYNLCISRDGSSLFVGSLYTVVRINTSTAIMTLAGVAYSTGSTDGVGSSARFNGARGIALNGDETALIVTDYNNKLVRRIELSTNTVSTIAGATATTGLVDGPGLAARFYNPFGGKWYCNTTSLLCGLLIADYGNGAIRFVAVEEYYTPTTSAQSTPAPPTPAPPALCGLVDGPGLSARFYNPWGGKWYCNTTSLLCGLLIADYGNGAIRFVAVEEYYTPTTSAQSTPAPPTPAPPALCTNADCHNHAISWSGTVGACSCTCDPTWTDGTCSTSNVCTNSDCSGNAASVSGNRPSCTCTCPAEWIGNACETSNVCTNADCYGHATTVSGNRPNCMCTCAPEWTGTSCVASNVCTDDPDCNNHATSVSGNRPSCTCACPPEWVGSACETSNVCTNSADCSSHATSFSGNRPSCTCNCPSEWVGS